MLKQAEQGEHGCLDGAQTLVRAVLIPARESASNLEHDQHADEHQG
jgi:hypothetical protein